MSKGLEALTELKRCVTSAHLNTRDFVDIALDVEKTSNAIEKELKALEIIKRLPKDYVQTLIGFLKDDWFKDENYYDFIGWCGDETPILISKEEYDLLKEELE